MRKWISESLCQTVSIVLKLLILQITSSEWYIKLSLFCKYVAWPVATHECCTWFEVFNYRNTVTRRIWHHMIISQGCHQVKHSTCIYSMTIAQIVRLINIRTLEQKQFQRYKKVEDVNHNCSLISAKAVIPYQIPLKLMGVGIGPAAAGPII